LQLNSAGDLLAADYSSGPFFLTAKFVLPPKAQGPSCQQSQMLATEGASQINQSLAGEFCPPLSLL
jgi:hypothetical protein